MKLDLSKLKDAAAKHTAETQRLLDENAARVAECAAAAKAVSDVQLELDNYTAEIMSQTSALKAFNDANAVPAASA